MSRLLLPKMSSNQSSILRVSPMKDIVLRWNVRKSSFCLMIAAVIFSFSISTPQAKACPFCSGPQLTLSEQIAQTDAAVIAEWVSGVKPDFDAGTAGSTVYRIKNVINSPSTPKLEQKQEITVDGYYPGDAESSVLILSTLDGELSWMSPLDISDAGYDYVKNAPSPEDDPGKRLAYFLTYLESNDPLLADDAYAEFANAPYKTIVSIKDQFPREKIRQWVFSDETSVTRIGLYGLMIGLCGNEEDKKLLEEKVVANDVEFRLGIDGIMAGYLILAGEAGLAILEDAKLKPSLESPSKVPFSETFATLQSIKFMWEYGGNRISKERLRGSQRILLENSSLADLVIIDLARWQDWSIIGQLKDMYGQEPYDVPAIKRSIVGYLIQCVKQKPTEEGKPVPEFVTQAEEFLAELEVSDPKTVKVARLLFR
ncbi:MAG: hypothetical protein JKY95_14125 [Planctomycetaceae bacterium]|nr:hypothetical protein [Planctomycetaceae bacterium]